MKELNVFERWARGYLAVRCDTDIQEKAFLFIVADHPAFCPEDEFKHRWWVSDEKYLCIDYLHNCIDRFNERERVTSNYETMTFDEFIEAYWKERFEDERCV